MSESPLDSVKMHYGEAAFFTIEGKVVQSFLEVGNWFHRMYVVDSAIRKRFTLIRKRVLAGKGLKYPEGSSREDRTDRDKINVEAKECTLMLLQCLSRTAVSHLKSVCRDKWEKAQEDHEPGIMYKCMRKALRPEGLQFTRYKSLTYELLSKPMVGPSENVSTLSDQLRCVLDVYDRFCGDEPVPEGFKIDTLISWMKKVPHLLQIAEEFESPDIREKEGEEPSLLDEAVKIMVAIETRMNLHHTRAASGNPAQVVQSFWTSNQAAAPGGKQKPPAGEDRRLPDRRQDRPGRPDPRREERSDRQDRRRDDRPNPFRDVETDNRRDAKQKPPNGGQRDLHC